jgi:hypothetical protein
MHRHNDSPKKERRDTEKPPCFSVHVCHSLIQESVHHNCHPERSTAE